MSTLFRSRRLLALLAAYAIALQALLLPLTVAAFAMPDAGLCTSVDGQSGPAGHETGYACTTGCGMPCGAHTLLAPPAPGDLAVPRASVGAIAPSPLLAVILPPATRGPHSPRAPPSV